MYLRCKQTLKDIRMLFFYLTTWQIKNNNNFIFRCIHNWALVQNFCFQKVAFCIVNLWLMLFCQYIICIFIARYWQNSIGIFQVFCFLEFRTPSSNFLVFVIMCFCTIKDFMNFCFSNYHNFLFELFFAILNKPIMPIQCTFEQKVWETWMRK